ncbi:OmpA/MotB domain protein [Rhodothermus marinus SG0.5JP17-172]|uniref:OmpA family protein n=1 Tax=Rhodothermus marinus TaxID=29549 RepID=UPI000223DB81|nr:OmpA family protein [Rhodothermus marinus]AEN74055.1 OmpA/MotB domain protein [Rhodothermus marinus SG0.5JP17-172]
MRTTGAIFFMLALLLAGCARLSNTEKGAAVGAGAGAVVGGAIGKATGNTARGAILGAIVGGTAGAIIGQRMDRQAAEMQKELPDARIERVGEGILVTFDSGILFDFDSATLRPEAREKLRRLAESLKKYPETEVLIVGHTDSTGPEEYNQRLSERRAEAAAAFLMQQGIRPSRIRTMGKGETEPIASNATEEGRQLNRRVEIAIFASETYRKEVQQSY